jgi:hypothetical protein
MPDLHSSEILKLEKRTSQLLDLISKAQLGNTQELKNFLLHIHNPGWTTIAETAFVNAILDSIQAQQISINEQIKSFVKASGMVSGK